MARRLLLALLACSLLTAAAFSIPRDGGAPVSRAVSRAVSRPAPAAPTAATIPAPPCVPAAVPSIDLEQGLLAFGEPIRALQEQLGVTADGVYGPITAAAVAALPAPGCPPSSAEQQTLDALGALQAAQDELVATAQARRSAPAASSSGFPRGCPAGGCVGESTPCAIPSFVCDRETASINQYNLQGSGASGKYQFLQSTWNGYGGYANAADAPESVQDAKAQEVWAGGAGCSAWAAC